MWIKAAGSTTRWVNAAQVTSFEVFRNTEPNPDVWHVVANVAVNSGFPVSPDFGTEAEAIDALDQILADLNLLDRST